MLQTELIAPVPELLAPPRHERGPKCAYRDARSQVTYAELFDRTANIAGHLADNGVEPGDTVAIMLPNSVQWVEACFAHHACWRAWRTDQLRFLRAGNRLPPR